MIPHLKSKYLWNVTSLSMALFSMALYASPTSNYNPYNKSDNWRSPAKHPNLAVFPPGQTPL